MKKLNWLCVALYAAFTLSGCASFGRHSSDSKTAGGIQSAAAATATEPVVDRRLVHVGLELLNPASPKYNPEKGRAYLEYALKHGFLKQIEMPAPVLLELLKSEKVATERSHNLEQQIEIMKEIDLNREESL